jgi:hypothetical protein
MKAKQTSKQEAIQVFVTLLDEIWAEVNPLIGGASLAALFSSACRRSARDFPALSEVQVSIDGVKQDTLVKALSALEIKEITRGMGDLVRNLIMMFESVAGSIIVKQVLPKVAEAERQVGTLHALRDA